MLDLHGAPRSLHRTTLNSTALPGDLVIHLTSNVLLNSSGWKTGDQLVIAATSFAALDTETLTIANISSDGLTVWLTSALIYKHIGLSISLSLYHYLSLFISLSLSLSLSISLFLYISFSLYLYLYITLSIYLSLSLSLSISLYHSLYLSLFITLSLYYYYYYY